MNPCPCPVIHADAHWRTVDFISDLHLSAESPATFAAWERYLQETPADAVWILGDLFEVWVGDDAALSHPDSFEGHCVQALKQATQRLSVSFLPGNRDFLVGDDLLAHCEVRRLADPTVLHIWDRRVLVSHGDAWCLDDVEYQAFRQQVRSPAWQNDFLSKPLLERQAVARHMRQASETRKSGLPDMSLWADVDRDEALKWMGDTNAADFVHGHTHRPGSQPLAPGRTRHVLSDWDRDGQTPRSEALRLTREGWQRVSLR